MKIIKCALFIPLKRIIINFLGDELRSEKIMNLLWNVKAKKKLVLI
jgi:hypothetical protein